MSQPTGASAPKPVTPASLLRKKQRGERITVLTAYDYPLARLADQAGIDCLLVSDVLGQVGLGYSSTLPVTVKEIAHHTRAVLRGATRSFVIAKMPQFSAAGSRARTVRNAEILVKGAGAGGLEVEGGTETIPVVRVLAELGIPVMPHIGLTGQHALRHGSFAVQGRSAEEARGLLELARALERAGAFALMLECIPAEVAGLIREAARIPVLGIGCGASCDGQILVPQDMLGLFDRFVPKFVKVYRDLSREILEAFGEFKAEVEAGSFPGPEHGYAMDPEQLEELRRHLAERRAGRPEGEF
ncbi:MAG: 3-methyl-2-oxobutanoate hydroxymethyltransferase [Spirochaetales bacterium]|nr:3-methyl-2-oxobutanoate hydroxymethyltransferase [Spirochaetales bacterium]